ncbi:MAG TPA: hypothetical protein VKA07_12395 [Candidatus Sulfotelmatobacter sp.]|nr:hypothetical protein [Candidatus Sulfotelmatobacter sp.]
MRQDRTSGLFTVYHVGGSTQTRASAADAPHRLGHGVVSDVIDQSDASEYNRYRAAQVFRGEADAESRTTPSFGRVKEAAVTFPGAIGLVEIQEIKPGIVREVLKIDGDAPGEARYPLH